MFFTTLVGGDEMGWLSKKPAYYGGVLQVRVNWDDEQGETGSSSIPVILLCAELELMYWGVLR